MLRNPFFVYVTIFGGALLLYQFGWSSIYPEITESVLWFFLATFVLAGLAGIAAMPALQRMREHTPDALPNWMVWTLFAGFVADIAYTGGVPLWLLATGVDYKYTEFGIPTLHVAIVTFGGTFAAVRFADYLYSKDRRYMLQACLPLVYDILIVNRGAALLLLVSCAFILIIKQGRISARLALSGMVVLLASLFVFGLIGDMRSGDNAIEEAGQPTEQFTESSIPKTYFWTYVYLTSPIANFVKTVEERPLDEPSIGEFLVSELLPDFISKRALPLLGAEERTDFDQISPALNVGTVFARSYVYAAWFGVTTMAAMLFAFIMFYLVVMSRKAYAVPALALLNTLVVFCVFDNMVAFTGMSLQLAWLMFIPVVRRKVVERPTEQSAIPAVTRISSTKSETTAVKPAS